MSKSEIVSIVMPAHNASRFIAKTIDSILEQDYSRWELIIVDDGSTDQTGEICDEYAAKDTRIKVIHKENLGVSAARNDGIRACSGEYIAFVDADDLLPSDSLRIRVEQIEDKDLFVGRYNEISETDEMTKESLSFREKEWTSKQSVENIANVTANGYQGYLWNKLYKRSVIQEKGILFEEGISHNEDRLFNVIYASNCNGAKLSDDLVYCYRQLETGAMGSLKRLSDKDFDALNSDFDAYEMLISYIENRYPDLYYKTIAGAMAHALALRNKVDHGEDGVKSFLIRTVRKYGRTALKAPNREIGFQKKVKIFAHCVLGR